jgi:hypothetical protein
MPRWSFAVAALCAAMAAPATASAATQIGQTGDPEGGCGSDNNVVQAMTAGPPSYAVPAGGGVITGWSFDADSNLHVGRLMVLRPTASPDEFIVVGRSQYESFSGMLDVFLTRIPVQAGDLLGMRMLGGNFSCLMTTSDMADQVRHSNTSADPPDGATQTLNMVISATRILIAASVEADADADGFGDETQDQCPGQAGPNDGCAAPDTSAPDTAITKGPKDKTKKKQATFQFTSSEPGSTFRCAVDSQALKVPCTSPYALKVKKGRHAFQVQATDQAGNADGSPATDTWKVKRRRKKK